MTCKNILSNLESAEESVRQALITSLNEKNDRNLTDMFSLLGNIQDVIELFQHPHDKPSLYTVTGKDMDRLDDVVVKFPTDYNGYDYDPVADWEHGNININTQSGDTTTFSINEDS